MLLAHHLLHPRCRQRLSAPLSPQVDLVALDEVPLLVSFKTDRAGRPRWANQMWVFNTFGDMLDLDALQLTLPGIEFEGIKAPRSALVTYALKQLQAQALAIAFNVFRCVRAASSCMRVCGVMCACVLATVCAQGGAWSASPTAWPGAGRVRRPNRAQQPPHSLQPVLQLVLQARTALLNNT